jgi:hypothetical protein
MERTLSQATGHEPATPVKTWPQDEWWREYNSPDLDQMMDIALKDNLGLRRAIRPAWRSRRRGGRWKAQDSCRG